MEHHTNERPTFQPTEKWPLQEAYKQRLHDEIQRWGDFVAPIVATESEEITTERTDFFQFLMEAVPRDDADTACLLQTLRAQMHESTRSWYTDKPGTLSESLERDMSQRDFERLFAIYRAGRTSVLT